LKICIKCHSSNNPAARFCRGCGTPLSVQPQAAALQTGKLPPIAMIANRYLIVSLVGRGGMGAVYLVTDTRLGHRKCALKEMSISAFNDPKERQRAIRAFEQEARILANLSHLSLPRVTDHFSERNKHFLVMDYVEGESLLEMLEKRHSPFSEAQVLDWADQLCDVLHYLHSQIPPIIYRDLKPENIIVSPDGKAVRLIDFGIARTYKPQKGQDTTKMGTPGYAPPEQYGKGQSDARSDVYALGVTLFELLTLHDPATNSKPFEFPKIRDLSPSISSYVALAIERAIEPIKVARWQSAEEFGRALRPPQPAPASSFVSVTKVVATPVSTVVVPQPLAKPRAVVPPTPASVYSMPISSQQFADHWPRFGAFFVDGLIIGAGGFLLTLPFIEAASEEAIVFYFLLLFLWSFGYYTYFHFQSGQTPGKKLFHIKVARRSGASLTFWRSFWRTVIFLIPPGILNVTCFLGWVLYLLPLIEKDRRALHDLLVDTCVVNT
jgi:serine/threonine protein kinase